MTEPTEVKERLEALDGRANAVTVTSRLLHTRECWLKMFKFTYDGEDFEYGIDVAETSASEAQAEAGAMRRKATRMARLSFLRDVPLNMELPN